MGIRLITGGIRSGKSRFAEQLCRESGKPVVYVATSQVHDAEMAARILDHRRRRPSSWSLKEEPLDLAAVAADVPAESLLLLDSLTAWVSNVLAQHPYTDGDRLADWRAQVLAQVESDTRAWLSRWSGHEAVIVTDEIGLGGIAMHPLSRCFQDALGWVNQEVAKRADEVWFVVAGVPWRVKG